MLNGEIDATVDCKQYLASGTAAAPSGGSAECQGAPSEAATGGEVESGRNYYRMLHSGEGEGRGEVDRRDKTGRPAAG